MAIGFSVADMRMFVLVAGLFAGSAGAADPPVQSGTVLLASGRPDRPASADHRPADPANGAGLHALVQSWRGANNGLGQLRRRLDRLTAERSELRSARPRAAVRADIDALDPAAFDSDAAYNAPNAALTAESLAAPGASERARLLAENQAEIRKTEAGIARLEAARDAAWLGLIRGRDMSDDALDVLRRKLAAN